ncbi:hypothetical protein H2204_012007 [Knufia peltigerae]|nr:hypothetical protein H2204_012007 [Knufia peltigerae]
MLRNHPTFSPSRVEITYTPIFLGGLMKQCNNTTPISIANKGVYIDKERRRWTRQFNIPMRTEFPPGFPMSTPTLNVQRFLTALNLTSPKHLVTALDVLYGTFWAPPDTDATGTKVWETQVFAGLLKKVIPSEIVDDCLNKMSTKQVKTELSSRTQQAYEDGAFGLPWFQCETVDGQKEGFWGFDHMGQVVRFLGLNETIQDGTTGELKPLL